MVSDVILAQKIASEGVSWPEMRRHGLQIYPDASDWVNLDRRSKVRADAALALMLMKHLAERKVLKMHDAASAVSFFKDAVTRYALLSTTAIKDLRHLKGETENFRVPAIMIEVVEGRWVRMGTGLNVLFDVQEQKETSTAEMTASRPAWMALWSHTVCLLPLMLRIYPVEDRHGDEHIKSEDPEREA